MIDKEVLRHLVIAVQHLDNAEFVASGSRQYRLDIFAICEVQCSQD